MTSHKYFLFIANNHLTVVVSLRFVECKKSGVFILQQRSSLIKMNQSEMNSTFSGVAAAGHRGRGRDRKFNSLLKCVSVAWNRIILTFNFIDHAKSLIFFNFFFSRKIATTSRLISIDNFIIINLIQPLSLRNQQI
jgi:hypothetical protein